MNTDDTQGNAMVIDEHPVLEARRYVIDPAENDGPTMDAFVIQCGAGLDSTLVLVSADHKYASWQMFWGKSDLKMRADTPWPTLVERAAARYRAGNPHLYARIADERSAIDATQ